jgi:hypothetical protein
MELVLKLPKVKPPFIGILFDKSWDGEKMNCDLVEAHRNAYYSIEFEYCNSHLNLRLMSQELLTIRNYAHLKFDAEKLKSWLYMSKMVNAYNFGHVIIERDQHILLKTQHKKLNFVLKMDKCKLVVEENNQMYV